MFSNHEPLMSRKTVQEGLMAPDTPDTTSYNSWVSTIPAQNQTSPDDVCTLRALLALE